MVAAGGGGLTEGAREERGGVLLEIKLKETIRTCLNQTGAKVSLNWARAIFQRTASLGEAPVIRPSVQTQPTRPALGLTRTESLGLPPREDGN